MHSSLLSSNSFSHDYKGTDYILMVAHKNKFMVMSSQKLLCTILLIVDHIHMMAIMDQYEKVMMMIMMAGRRRRRVYYVKQCHSEGSASE